MGDRRFDAAETAAAFREASHWWRSLVGGIEDHQWDQPGLGQWDVKELVAHGNRAFKTVFEYVDGPVKDPTPIASAAAYFRIVLAEQTPHVHIAARAKREAAELADPVTTTDDLAVRAMRVLDRMAPETELHLFVGEMALSQYLATRVVELVVHGTDLSEAIGIPSSPPIAAAKVALAVLVDLSTADDVGTIVRLLTGRSGSLPLANVLA
jgi:uncharacterized protein (TIGR03083 family)